MHEVHPEGETQKVGFHVQWKNGSRSYDYYSFAVRGDIAFRSFGRFSWYGDAAGLISCAIHRHWRWYSCHS
jgi:hypothetical protein